jgi:hypothetical protein
MGNAFGRIGQKPDRLANAVEDAHCDGVEALERAEEREDERDRRASDAETARLNAVTNAQLAEIRRLPKAPELGAPVAEAKAICAQERGQFLTKGNAYSCSVGGPFVFAGNFDGSNRITRLDVYYEGADLAASRRKTEELLGPVESETLTPEGFRAFLWRGGTVAVAMYPKGVRLTSIDSSPKVESPPPTPSTSMGF